MSDVDIIVKSEDAMRAMSVLSELGYETKRGTEYEFHAKKNDVHIELHTDFFNGTLPFSKILSDPFDHVKKTDGYSAELSLTDLCLFNILHCLKHYKRKGAGIRRVLDLYFLEEKCATHIDKDRIESVLRNAGLYEDAAQLISLSHRWFDSANGGEGDSFAEELIKRSGVHGVVDFLLERELNEVKQDGGSFAKTRYVFKKIFMPKRELYSTYPLLKEHSMPYFICVLYRLFTVIKRAGGIKGILQYIKFLYKVDRQENGSSTK